MANSDSGGDTFESNIKQINNAISLQIGKWKLKSIPSVDHFDIAQIIRLHIFEKWDLYRPELPLGNWLSVVISNRIKNLLRNNYYKFSSVCLNCPSNLGDGHCKIFGEIGSMDCALFRNWVKTKKDQHDVSLPVTIEDHTNQLNSMPFNEINFDDQLEDLKIKLQTRLSSNDYKIFLGLYIDNKSEAELSKELGYKINTKTEVNRQIKNVKATILDVVKKILREED